MRRDALAACDAFTHHAHTLIENMRRTSRRAPRQPRPVVKTYDSDAMRCRALQGWRFPVRRIHRTSVVSLLLRKIERSGHSPAPALVAPLTA
jgi:hypothetical protein